ncbi:MAG: hypothetical protein GF353_23465 [Candidatus Lokiarchaeota archaeon]|nr:hypothetical protein [Candidatus Lokiarchaeota archaeon]
MTFCFLIVYVPFLIMIDTKSSLRFENNIAKILSQAVDLFRETGLTELADKWDRILKNYYMKKGFH